MSQKGKRVCNFSLPSLESICRQQEKKKPGHARGEVQAMKGKTKNPSSGWSFKGLERGVVTQQHPLSTQVMTGRHTLTHRWTKQIAQVGKM